MDVDYWLNGICFQWDRRKAARNLRDHGVAFETACQVFFDPFIRWHDSEVVGGEERERVIGMTTAWQLLHRRARRAEGRDPPDFCSSGDFGGETKL